MYQHKSGGDLSEGGKFLKVPGTFLVFVADVDDQPSNKDGRPIDNAICQFKTKVLAGTSPGQEDKDFELTLFAPNLSNKDGGEFGRKIIDRVLLATALATKQQLEAKSQIDIDFTASRGRMFYIKIRLNNKNYAEMDGCSIWHIDDPAVSEMPKRKDAMAAYPKEFPFRWIGGQPANEAGDGAAPASSAAEPATTAVNAASDVDNFAL
ncbi:MAG: hypothetical protein AAGB04_00395 [Pseudomonadota bacterium]